MKKNHSQLIYDLSEISGLFADSKTLESFLEKVVDLIARHMQAEVCSVYLFNERTRQLVLKATKGLNLKELEKVALNWGEGLSGQAVKEMRPICVSQASQSPGYRFFPGLGEEGYESFLAVPIVRGQKRIGAIVVQNIAKNSFDQEDVRVFQALTAQLATTIETAHVLMSFDETKEESGEPKGLQLKLIKGKSSSGGFAYGDVRIFEQGCSFDVAEKNYAKKLSWQDFLDAVTYVEGHLKELEGAIESQLSDVSSLIFTAQILMLKDQAFLEEIKDAFDKTGQLVKAIVQTLKSYERKFDQLPDEYLREKKQDLMDVGQALLRCLCGTDDKKIYEGSVIVARELFPTDIIKFSIQKISGIIVLSGGITSHLSILSRSLRIPLIISGNFQLLKLSSGSKVLLDAEQGNIYINPEKDIVATFEAKLEEAKALEKVEEQVGPETYTSDGERIKLLSNINLLNDIKQAVRLKAEGIGLYRTEFPFMIRAFFPTEEEQFGIYKKLSEGFKNKEVTFRTLDIGGDKVLSHFNYIKENNPFLGMRSIRFSLQHKKIFREQIRAILRAGFGCQTRIMFPMISSIEEFLEAKGEIEKCCLALEEEGVKFSKNSQVGLMIELPSVVGIIDGLIAEADFISIGTNDFVQYMLAVDRTNQKVSQFYLPHHPSVIKALYSIVQAANKAGKDVSVCGDMAHEQKYVPLLLGMGVKTLSLDALYIPQIQKIIQKVELKKARDLVENLARMNRIDHVEEAINTFNKELDE